MCAAARIQWRPRLKSGRFGPYWECAKTVLEVDSKMGIRSWGRAIAAAIVLTIGGLIPASAGPAEVELLSSYVGTWAGESALVGGEKPEEFRCRLTISKGRQARINYAGRCSLVSMNLSVSGTIL